MKTYNYIIGVGIVCLGLLSSCEKFLDAKPSMSIAAVETIKDMQLLLDDISEVNQGVSGFIEMGSDDYYVEDNTLNGRPVFEQDVYFWRDPSFLASDLTLQWVKSYKPIMVANVVLESLDRLSSDVSEAEKMAIRGQALFIRGFAYFLIAQIYVPPYHAGEKESPYGLLVRRSSDINSATERITLGQSYDLILEDLKQSASYLPALPDFKTRASQWAAYSVLARVYLSMSDYDNALHYAEKALAINNELMNFNTLNPNASLPIEMMNKETIYYAMCTSALLLAQSRANISPELLEMYQPGDLRRNIFYYTKTNGTIGFKGGYTGNATPVFVGPTVDELYLIRSECLIRKDKVAEGLQVLNNLLRKRWDPNLFTPIATSEKQKALDYVLDERRKELVFRGLRWSDLRRLNQDPLYKRTIKRTAVINGEQVTVELVPESKHYTYQIPAEVLEINGLPQNPR